MADPVPAPVPVSPTGEPILPQRVVRWLLPVYLILSGSGLGLLVQLDAAPKVMAIAAFVVGALGTLLGVSSQGIRRAGPLVLLLLLPLSGCCALHTDPCCVQTPTQVALALRANDEVEAALERGEITPEEAAKRLKAHAADARMGFPSYEECRP